MSAYDSSAPWLAFLLSSAARWMPSANFWQWVGAAIAIAIILVAAFPNVEGWLPRLARTFLQKIKVFGLWRTGIIAIFLVSLGVVIGLGTVGWPGMLGFPNERWSEVWVAFWGSAFPAIVTAAIITVGAGIWLSNRDRRIEKQAKAESKRLNAVDNVSLLWSHLTVALNEQPGIDF